MTPGRVLGLDYGSARCGVAVSDPTRTLATPLEPILRPGTRKGFNRLLAAIRAQDPVQVVVGLPLSLSGADSAQTRRDARLRGAAPDRAAACPSRSTTSASRPRMAQQRAGAAAEDSRAAAVLLEGFLERDPSDFPGVGDECG